MRVGEVMSRTVRTLNQYESIDHAAGVLRFWHFRHLPVVDGSDHVIGMITPADLLEAARNGADLTDEPVAQVMSTPVATAQEDELLESAIDRMLRQKVHAMPVLGEGGRLVGIVADRDLLTALRRAGPGLPPLGEVAVDAVMTRDPVTVEAGSTLGEAAVALLQGGFRHLPVVDDARRVVGLISERDVRSRLGAELADFARAPVDALSEPASDSMTPDPICVESGTPLADVVETFATERVGAIPVLDGDRLLGIVSYVDVLTWIRDRQRP